MKTIAITDDAWSELAASVPPGTPVTTVNLLRFREETLYPEGSGFADCSGREAYYERYASNTVPLALALGGRILLSGSAVSHPVCPPDEHWDDILIFEYPDIAALAALGQEPSWQANAIHRTASLSDSRLFIIVRNALTG